MKKPDMSVNLNLHRPTVERVYPMTTFEGTWIVTVGDHPTEATLFFESEEDLDTFIRDLIRKKEESK